MNTFTKIVVMALAGLTVLADADVSAMTRRGTKYGLRRATKPESKPEANAPRSPLDSELSSARAHDPYAAYDYDSDGEDIHVVAPGTTVAQLDAELDVYAQARDAAYAEDARRFVHEVSAGNANMAALVRAQRQKGLAKKIAVEQAKIAALEAAKKAHSSGRCHAVSARAAALAGALYNRLPGARRAAYIAGTALFGTTVFVASGALAAVASIPAAGFCAYKAITSK